MSHLLEVFYSDHCPACPEARAVVQRFVGGRHDIVLIEHSVDHDADLARSYHLIATPALVIDRRRVMYGVPHLATLAAWVEASVPALA